MAYRRELLERPLVVLDAEKLLGMRQMAKVAAGRAGAASNDLSGSGSEVPRAQMSRLFSKIGTIET